MNDLSVIKQSGGALAHVDEQPQSAESLISMAIQKGVDVGTMERLMAMRREVNEERAKKAYNEAFAAFQAECPAIHKRKAGYKNSYHYAPLEDIIPIVQPLLRKHGFSFTVDTPIEKDDSGVTAIFELRHKEGHSEKKQFRVPLDTRATLMNAPQQFGAACSYAKRYVLVNALGLLTSDEDIDGNANRPKPRGPSSVQPDSTDLKPLAAELWALLKPVRGQAASWDIANDYLINEAVIDADELAPNFTADRFRSVINKVKAKGLR